MKFLSQAIFLTWALGTSADNSVSEANRDRTLSYWNSSQSTTVGAMPYLIDNERWQARSVTHGSSISVMMRIMSTNESTGTGRRLDEMAVPYPADGAVLEKTGNPIHFRESSDESSELSDVECFHFIHNHPNQSFYVCDEDKIDFDDKANIAEVKMSGFAFGTYTWYAVDSNGVQSDSQTFEVVEAENTMEDEGIIQEASWPHGGQVQEAAGRIYFEAGGNDYGCTGTAIKDNKSGRTLILTSAHCVYDDYLRTWASNVVFIPNRDEIQTNLTADEIFRQCHEDVCGCWTISAGVVLERWGTVEWPYNLPYDYGVFVVDDVGAHEGVSCGSDALDEAVDAMDIFCDDINGSYTTALGYSLEHKPDFRYCAENVTTVDLHYDIHESFLPGTETYYLNHCMLTPGASGGPWLVNGKIASVLSWFYYGTGEGSGGPIITEEGARCLINAARELDFVAVSQEEDGEQGIFVNCFDRPCVTREEDEAAGRKLRGDGRVLCEHH